MAVKKIDKKYVLSDSSVNCYGFRLLTDGYMKDEYAKNPIGYHMHDRESGVLLRWDDLTIEGDNVCGKPVINMSNPRGEQTVSEIEDLFLNAASVGFIVALEWSDDPALKLPGQTGPTVTKWYNRECSLCDIPGNYNALAKLYDDQLNELNLSDFTKQKLPMQGIVLTAAHLSLLMLSATSSEADVTKALNDLTAKAAKTDALQKQLNDLTASTTKSEVDSIIAGGLAGKKLTKELAETLAKDYANNPTGLKALVDAMPAHTSIVKELNTNKLELSAEVMKKSWDELAESGELEDIKLNHPEVYKAKFKKEFGNEPKV